MTPSTTACTSCSKPTSGAALCERCTKTLDIALANVAAYYADAGSVVRTRQTRYGSGISTRGSIGKEQPLPVDGRFLDVNGSGTQARWDTWNTIVTWCRVVMAEQPELAGPVCVTCLHPSCHAVRRRRWPRNTVPSMCAYLERQRRYVLAEPWAADLLDELTHVERRLRYLVDRPADGWYAGECGAVDAETEAVCTRVLYADPTNPFVRCRDCGTTWSVAERRDWLIKEAEDREATVRTLARIVTTLGAHDASESRLENRISQWVTRGRLKPNGKRVIDGKPRPVYRVGDVLDLLARDHAAS